MFFSKVLRSLPSSKEALVNHLLKNPKITPCAFVAKTASVVGNVSCEQDSSIWFSAVVRADINSISIGKRTNIQDGVVIHVTRKYPVIVGDDVSIGHGAILHGCTVGNNTLVGMGSVLLDGCKIGHNSLVAAGSVVTPGKSFPDGSLIVGSPSKVKRELNETELAEIKDNSARYVEYSKFHANKN